MLRPQTINGGSSFEGLRNRAAEWQNKAIARPEYGLPVLALDFAIDEIHSGRADEACNEQIRGIVIEVERHTALLN